MPSSSNHQIHPQQQVEQSQQQQRLSRTTRSSLRNSKIYYREGRDFYDDQYYAHDVTCPKAAAAAAAAVHHTSSDDDDDEDSLDDQLNFSPLRRHDQLQMLHQAYERIARMPTKETEINEQQQQPSICLITGISGTGKSTLFDLFAQELLEPKEEEKEGNQSKR
jgi:signal recognition particle GTPase